MDENKMNALESFVGEVDAESPTAQAEQQQAEAEAAQAITEAQAWAVIPKTVGSLVCMLAPELGELYSEERCLEWGNSMVPVAAKYGWGGPSMLPELGLLISTGTLAIPTVMVVRAKLDAMKKAAPKPAPRAALDDVVDASAVPTGGDGGG